MPFPLVIFLILFLFLFVSSSHFLCHFFLSSLSKSSINYLCYAQKCAAHLVPCPLIIFKMATEALSAGVGRGMLVLRIFYFGICPASLRKQKTKVRPDYSSAPTQLALLSPICFPDLKGRQLQRAVTLDDWTPQ